MIKINNYGAERINTDVAFVASHSFTLDNTIEQFLCYAEKNL